MPGVPSSLARATRARADDAAPAGGGPRGVAARGPRAPQAPGLAEVPLAPLAGGSVRRLPAAKSQKPTRVTDYARFSFLILDLIYWNTVFLPCCDRSLTICNRRSKHLGLLLQQRTSLPSW